MNSLKYRSCAIPLCQRASNVLPTCKMHVCLVVMMMHDVSCRDQVATPRAANRPKKTLKRKKAINNVNHPTPSPGTNNALRHIPSDKHPEGPGPRPFTIPQTSPPSSSTPRGYSALASHPGRSSARPRSRRPFPDRNQSRTRRACRSDRRPSHAGQTAPRSRASRTHARAGSASPRRRQRTRAEGRRTRRHRRHGRAPTPESRPTRAR